MNEKEMLKLLQLMSAGYCTFDYNQDLNAFMGITTQEKEEEEMVKKVDYNEKAKDNLLSRAQDMNYDCPTLQKNGRNLTEMYLSGKLDACYHRDAAITAIQKILLRKSKANVLLTGKAGCGKTAIAEGLAGVLAERDIKADAEILRIKAEYDAKCRKWRKEQKLALERDEEFNEPAPAEPTYPAESLLSHTIAFELSLTAMTAGTKYRGEFEEKIQQVIEECRKHPNIILFIDEIHQIVSAGSSDNSDNAAQMLKPALARRDIRCVGATTTDEAQYIWKDKALARRFNEVKIDPLCGSAAEETAESIFADYCRYHSISAPSVSIAELLSKIQYFLPQTVFPDNFINVVDETLAGARYDAIAEVDMTHFNATLSRMAGVIIV